MTTGIVQVPTLTPQYDLLIASRKCGHSLTSQASAPITWIKAAGFPQRPPQDKNTTLAHPTVQRFLQGYELVGTEVKQFEVIRKYRKIERTFNFAPGDGGLSDQDIDNIVVDQNRWPYPVNVMEVR